MHIVAPVHVSRAALSSGAGLRTRVTVVIAAAIIAALAVATPILLLQATAERRAIEEATRLRRLPAIAHIVEREAAASLALLDGLASTPSLHSGDLKSLYEQFAATRIPEGAFLSAYDDERQIINTLRPFGAPLPYIRDFPPEDQAAVGTNSSERLERFRADVGSMAAGAYVVFISRSVLQQRQTVHRNDGHTGDAIAGTREDAGGTGRLESVCLGPVRTRTGRRTGGSQSAGSATRTLAHPARSAKHPAGVTRSDRQHGREIFRSI